MPLSVVMIVAPSSDRPPPGPGMVAHVHRGVREYAYRPRGRWSEAHANNGMMGRRGQEPRRTPSRSTPFEVITIDPAHHVRLDNPHANIVVDHQVDQLPPTDQDDARADRPHVIAGIRSEL